MLSSLHLAINLLDFLLAHTTLDEPGDLHIFFSPRLIYTILSRGLTRLTASGARNARIGAGSFSSNDGWNIDYNTITCMISKSTIRYRNNKNKHHTNLIRSIIPSFIVIRSDKSAIINHTENVKAITRKKPCSWIFFNNEHAPSPS